jgi:hypothetical protein
MKNLAKAAIFAISAAGCAGQQNNNHFNYLSDARHTFYCPPGTQIFAVADISKLQDKFTASCSCPASTPLQGMAMSQSGGPNFASGYASCLPGSHAEAVLGYTEGKGVYAETSCVANPPEDAASKGFLGGSTIDIKRKELIPWPELLEQRKPPAPSKEKPKPLIPQQKKRALPAPGIPV